MNLIQKATALEAEKLICPNCQTKSVETIQEECRFLYGDGAGAVELAAIIPKRVCAACGFQYKDAEAEEAEEAAVRHHLGVMTPRQIRALRKHLHGLTIRQFAATTRIGAASLSRWEKGLKIQSTALDDYLYLLGWVENIDRLRMRRRNADSVEAVREAGQFRAIDKVKLAPRAMAFKL